MPIPEPSSSRPSNLTKQQQQDALAACYGVTPMPTQQLSESEIAHMRTLLAQHDSENKKVTIHDLNHPPREPYRFQKFPMMVYDLQNSYPSQDKVRPKANGAGVETVHIPAKVVSRLVQSEDQLQAALADGWDEEAPAFNEERVEPLSAQYSNEAGRIDAEIEATRPKRHYNRKVA